MEKKILVTYASRTGATKGVAEAVGKTLEENGCLVDVLAMQEVKDLSPYRVVVAGSAIQAGKWLPEAMRFVQEHQAELSRKRFAAFLVCMTLAMPNAPQYRSFAEGFFQPVRCLVNPVSEGLFAGMLNISQVRSFGDRIKFRLSVMMGVWKEGDHRDWNAIREWTVSLIPLIQG